MRFPKKILIAVASLGVAVSGSLIGTFILNDANVIKLKEDNLREYEAKFYSEGALLYETGKIKRGSVIGYGKDEKPIKKRTVDGKVFQFVGWDITGEGLPDILPNRIYSNFKANAVFWRLPTIEKLLMDPDLVAKLAELLQKLNIELTPEQIEKIMDWLMNLGIDWESIDMSVIEQLLDLLQIDLNQFMEMAGLDFEALMALLARPMFRYTASNAGAYYFRTQSYGNNYSDNTWTKADYYAKSHISDNSVNPLAFAADKLSQYLNPTHVDMKYLNQGEYYPVPVNEVNNTQNLDSDSYSLVNPTPAEPEEGYKFGATYSADAMSFVPACQNVAIIGSTMYFSNEAITNDEKEYRQYAKDHYLQVDDKYRSVFNGIIQDRGIVVDSTYNYLTQVLEYFSDGFEFDYEMTAIPKGEDKILYFLNNKHGIGTHFADATTMFFRTLGIPARCVNGYADYCEVAGEEREVTGVQNHYWTEIYLDGIGWMTFDACLATGVLGDEYSQYLFNSFLSPDPEQKNGVITDIQIELPKEHYYQGDSFNMEDVKFHVTYEDGSTGVLTADEMTYVSTINTNIVGQQTMTAIAISGTTVATAEKTVDILPVEPEKLEINKDSVQKVLFVGYPYNDSSISGEVTYNNGDNNTVGRFDLTSTPVDSLLLGEQLVTYNVTGYPEVSDTVTIKYINEPESSLSSIKLMPSEIETNPGVTLDSLLSKFAIIATYEDGSYRNVSKETGTITFTGDTNLSEAGNHIMYVNYTEGGVTKLATLTVEVKNRSTLSIYSSYLTPGSQKMYDGNNLEWSYNDLYIPFVYDAETLYLTVTNIVCLPNVDNPKTAGEYYLLYYFKIFDENEKDVTNEFISSPNFKLSLNNTVLTKGSDFSNSGSTFILRRTYTITQRPLVITSNDLYNINSTAEYEEATKYLSVHESDVYGLANGDTIYQEAAVYTGSVNPGGQADNSVSIASIIIHDSDGNDVTSSYDITFIPGTIYHSGVSL